MNNKNKRQAEDFDLASAQRKRFLRAKDEEEQRQAYRAQLITWDDWWRLDGPGA